MNKLGGFITPGSTWCHGSTNTTRVFGGRIKKRNSGAELAFTAPAARVWTCKDRVASAWIHPFVACQGKEVEPQRLQCSCISGLLGGFNMFQCVSRCVSSCLFLSPHLMMTPQALPIVYVAKPPVYFSASACNTEIRKLLHPSRLRGFSSTSPTITPHKLTMHQLQTRLMHFELLLINWQSTKS